MTKKFYTIALIILLSNIFFQANAQVELSGQIKDDDTKEALIFCSVSIYNLQDSLVVAGITNDKGFFVLPVKEGNYNLICNYMGYETDTLAISVESENKFLGIIKMKANVFSLNEVEIGETTSEFALDKEVELVTAKMRTGAANTSDVLDRIKGLSYDRYNNSIKVDGDDNVIILVNGLEKNQEYIKNLSPDRIKEVEVIRNPSGRYALEGYSAIINIILKSDYKGTEAYFETTPLFDIDTKSNNYLPINNLSLTYNYTYDKFNIYGKLNQSYTNINIYSESEKDYQNGNIIKYQSLDGGANLFANNFSNTYTAGIDYYVNPKHTISFESNIVAFPLAKSNTSYGYNIIQTFDGATTDNYISQNENNSNTQDFTNSLFYVFKINNQNTLNADFTYSNYSDKYINNINQSNGFEMYETGKNNKDYTKLYVEINHILNNKSSLMAGYGNTFRKVENDFATKTRLLSTDSFIESTNSSVLDESRHKIYSYYSLNISRKLSFKIGSAMEYSHPVSEGLDKTFIIYQPHLDFKIAAHKLLDIKIIYRADSNYPTIIQSTPFTHVVDQYLTETGNSDLKPELIHKVSVRFRVMQGLLSFEPYYNFSDNLISRTLSPTGNGMFGYFYNNVGNYVNKGIKGDFTIPLFKQSLIIQSNFDFFNSSITYNGKTNNLNDWIMNSQIIYMSQKQKTIAGLVYQKNIKKLINTEGYDYNNNDFWFLFVQQTVLKDKMTIMLGYMLPVDFGVTYNQGSFVDTELYRATNIYNISILKNMIMFKLTYRFNKGKSVKNIKKEIENEVEKKSDGLF